MTRSHLRLQETAITGVVILHRAPLRDARGSFERMFCAGELREAGFAGGALQVNRSRTMGAGVVRGLHYQAAPGREAKLISCLRGAVYDVAVDVRAGSPTFGRFVALRLDESADTGLLLPPGVAHGFQSLTEHAELLYMHSAFYDPALDLGVSVRDPEIGIDWPLPVQGLSARDEAWPVLSATQPWNAQA